MRWTHELMYGFPHQAVLGSALNPKLSFAAITATMVDVHDLNIPVDPTFFSSIGSRGDWDALMTLRAIFRTKKEYVPVRKLYNPILEPLSPRLSFLHCRSQVTCFDRQCNVPRQETGSSSCRTADDIALQQEHPLGLCWTPLAILLYGPKGAGGKKPRKSQGHDDRRGL